MLSHELTSPRLLIQKKLEILHGRTLSSEELHAVLCLDDQKSAQLMAVDRRRDDSITEIAQSLSQSSHINRHDIMMRLLGVWLILQIGHFISSRVDNPNIMCFTFSEFNISPLIDVVMLAVLWRYNDQNIQNFSNAYHRLSDIAQMSLGDVVELLTQRYLFAMFASTLVIGRISNIWFSTNYFVALDYILFFLFVRQTIPALFNDLKTLVTADSYSIETTQFIEIPIEIYRSFHAFWLILNRLKDCVVKHKSDFSKLLVFRPGSVYQTWRYAEVGVHALGSVPQGVSYEYIKRSMLDEDGVVQFRPTLSLWLLGLLNTLDGRLFHALLNCYHSDIYVEDVYCYRRKVNTVQRGFSLLLEHQHLVPIIYQLVCPKSDFDIDKLVQFSRGFIRYVQKDDRLLKRCITCIDLLCQTQRKPTLQEQLIVMCLSSDLYHGQVYLYQSRVDLYLSNEVSHTALLMLIVRDLSRFLITGEDSADYLGDSLYLLSYVLRSAASVIWSENVSSQRAIELVFNQLAVYLESPWNSGRRVNNLRLSVGRLASLSDEECIQESPVFYWSLLDCLNFSAHAAGVVHTVCGDAFKHFIAGRLLYYMGPSEISFLNQLLDDKDQKKNQAELVCHFLDTLMTTIEHDLVGCFQQSFEGSVELNDIMKFGVVQNASSDPDVPYVDASTRFLRGTVRFIENVEKRPGLRANLRKDEQKQRAQDRSLIYCLGLIFQHFGSGRIYGSEMLATLMYRNILGNPSYVKWCLTIAEVSLSLFSICRGIFSRSYREQWAQNAGRFTHGLYFIVTRSVFHVPRSCFFLAQLFFIAVCSLLYNLGRERVFVLCACCLGAMAIVSNLSLPMFFVPTLTCLFFYAFQSILDLVDRLMNPKLNVDTDVYVNDMSDNPEQSSSLLSSRRAPVSVPEAVPASEYFHAESVNSDDGSMVLGARFVVPA